MRIMYRRFLNNRDYLSIITEEALEQLTRGDEQRFEQAEQAAEASVVDYLTENYEIEKELDKGKFLFEYNKNITYPVGSHFYLDDQICEVIKAINGHQRPTPNTYWVEYDGLSDTSKVAPYSQMLTYQPGDLVIYGTRVYQCQVAHGYDFGDIRIPGVTIWETVDYVDWVTDWESVEFVEWSVVRYEGNFFALLTLENFDMVVNPMESDCWGMIGDYDDSLDTYELSEHEYVVYDGNVYRPVANPNAETPVVGVNVAYNDPRNYNLKRHMVQLALYELHKLISPNNISSVRLDDYDHTMQWLKDANRLKLNPQIPRKRNCKGEEVLDWQLATFQTDYNPYQNPWHI